MQAYFTPPEDDPNFSSNSPIPVLDLPVPDIRALESAPSDLIRGSTRHHFAWQEDDSGPIPSDIELVRGTEKNTPTVPQPQQRYPLSDYKPNIYFNPDVSNSDEVSKPNSSPQQPGYQWSRSYQNPIGSVYHAPDEESGYYPGFSTSGKRPRPISADVNRLFSVQEDVSTDRSGDPIGLSGERHSSNFKKGQ